MEEIAAKLGMQAPWAGALLLLVFWFLRFISKRDHFWKSWHQEQAAALRAMHDEHLDAREQSRKATAANTLELAATRAVLSELVGAVRELRIQIEHGNGGRKT